MNTTAMVRDETRSIYARVAELVCRPGMPKKQMDVKVSEALGGYPLWRLRACRLGEAGCFSAAAVVSLQERYRTFADRHAARAASAAETELARQAATDRLTLLRLRDQHAAELRRVNDRLTVHRPVNDRR